MSPVVTEKVRVGDRYIRADDAKITITKIDGHDMDYSILTSRGELFYDRITLPVPDTWTKAGSGPVEKVWCVVHPLREAEPGQIYCPDCVDQVAVRWAGLDPVEAADLTDSLLLEKDQGHD